MNIIYRRVKKRFFYNRHKIYKYMAKIIAIDEMLKKNSELLNTILTCKIEDEEDFDLDVIFERCNLITRCLKENKEILLEELFQLDHRAYLCLKHISHDYTKDFVVMKDEESGIDYPVPTFLTNKKEGVNYSDINSITLSIDFYKKNMRDSLRIVK